MRGNTLSVPQDSSAPRYQPPGFHRTDINAPRPCPNPTGREGFGHKSVFLLDRARPVFFGKTKENGGRLPLKRRYSMEQHIFGVTEVNNLVKLLLDNEPMLQNICVRGELSNYKM